MNKIQFQKPEKAQGMVEFALVLPILLLIILGIIGFGHLFFSYSSTVSASREAARFGAAVGVTQNNVPRYLDCDSIRNAAVNIGTIAGVANTPASVDIQWDQGPGTAVFGSCPVGGPADTGGHDIELGDRIRITITVPYHSIVPLVPIPDFNLTATTTRTIVRSLQIGEAPTAEPLCPRTRTHLWVQDLATESLGATSPASRSIVGDAVPMSVGVTPLSGTGTVSTASGLYIYDSTGGALFQQGFNAPGPASYSYTYWLARTDPASPYLVSAEYVGDVPNCWDNSALTNHPHLVDPAPTTLNMSTFNPAQVLINQNLTVTVQLSGVRQPALGGWAGEVVRVWNENGSGACNAVLAADGTGSCQLPLTMVGLNIIHAVFAGDDVNGDTILDYQPSAEITQNITVIEPTLIPSPTPDRACPTFNNVVFNPAGQYFSFLITNARRGELNVTGVTVDWPITPATSLQEIRLDHRNIGNSCMTSGPQKPDCLYENSTGAPPPTLILGNQVDQMMAGTIRNTPEEMRIVFAGSLADIYGTYRARVWFDGNCYMDVQYNYPRP